MDPNHLEEDELCHEFEIRAIDPNDPNKMERLYRLLSSELKGESKPPEDTQRLTRSTVSRELAVCANKAKDIVEFLGVAAREKDEQKLARGQSRLMHISDRVYRLQDFVPVHTGVQRLISRIQDYGRQVDLARDCLGSGEEGADLLCIVANDEAGKEQTMYEASGGVRRKTVAGAGSTEADVHIEPQAAIKASSDQHKSVINLCPDEDDQHQELTDGGEFDFPPLPIISREVHENAGTGQYNLTRPNTQQPAQSNGSSHNVQRQVPIVNRQGGSNGGMQMEEQSRPASRLSQNNLRQPHADRNRHYQGCRQVGPDQQPDRFAGGHRMHHWALRFDGSATSLSAEDFIFRVQRQAQLYGVSDGALVIGIGNLLVGRASEWFWTFQKNFGDVTWVQLKRAFLRRYAPVRETDYEIRSKIENRKQKWDENFNDFCQDVETLEARLTRRMSEDELVEVLRRNMLTSLRRAMWRERVANVQDLIDGCVEYERLGLEEDRPPAPTRQMRVHEIDDTLAGARSLHTQAFNGRARHVSTQVEDVNRVQPREVSRRGQLTCWNCRKVGHAFSECNQQYRARFCFGCGQRGIIKAECWKCAGNERTDGNVGGSFRPPMNNQPQSTSHADSPVLTRNPFVTNQEPK